MADSQKKAEIEKAKLAKVIKRLNNLKYDQFKHILNMFKKNPTLPDFVYNITKGQLAIYTASRSS